jgi:hypothetical protein
VIVRSKRRSSITRARARSDVVSDDLAVEVPEPSDPHFLAYFCERQSPHLPRGHLCGLDVPALDCATGARRSIFRSFLPSLGSANRR